MNVREILQDVGIKAEMIVSVIGSLELSVDKGYEISMKDIKTDDKVQAVKISPNIMWTDGTCRPAYSIVERTVTLFLNEAIK